MGRNRNDRGNSFKWKLNFGAGLRFQMQPGKNFRLDVGKEPGQPGMQVYMNMTEAF